MPSLISSTRSQNTLTLSLVATCPVEFSPRRVWDISENYLLCAERDSASYEEMPGYPSHILFTLLPHPGEPMHLSGDPFSLPVATFHLGLARNMRLSAFKLDEKADLLATVCRLVSPQSREVNALTCGPSVNNWNSAGQFLFFYSFAQGTPHQHAVQTILHLDSGLDRTGIVRVSIYKDHIGILLGYYIYILNWRTGDCRLVRAMTQRRVFELTLCDLPSDTKSISRKGHSGVITSASLFCLRTCSCAPPNIRWA